MKIKIRSIVTLVLITVIIALPSIVNGQLILDEKSFNDFLKLQQNTSRGMRILSENDISGSPYLSEEFVPGIIITKDKVKYTGVSLRYNIYNDEMEYKIGGNSYLAISNPKSLQEIKIGNDVFIYAYKKNKKGEQAGYYRQIREGKIQLLEGLVITFTKATSSSGYNQAQPPKFQRSADKFYLRIGCSEPMPISKRKDIKTIFGTESDLIYSFIKKHQLNVRKKDDLIKLTEYLNNN